MKTKKVLSLLLSTLLVLIIFVSCNSTSSNTTNGGLDKVKKSKTLLVGLDDSYPPMEFRDEKNNLAGFDIDMANEIGKRLGVKTQFVTTDFNGILLALKSGKFDIIIASLSITDERKKEIDFSKSYLDGGQIIIIKKGTTSIKKATDLTGKTLGVQLGTTGEQAAIKVQASKEVKKYDKITEALHDLSIGRVDCVIADKQVGEYYISKETNSFTVLSDTLTKEPTGIGFKKDDSNLKTAIQKALDNATADGTMGKLSIKWFGHDIYKQ